MLLNIPLSKLVPSRQNPRRVKPPAEAHKQFVASIRAFGLIEPLVVRPLEDDADGYQIIVGHRRYAALKDAHRGSKEDPKVPCDVRKMDDATAAAISLSENVVRERMHPLDEAEAFAALARGDGKDAESIASEFGVSPNYIRQRMKLATLAKPIKAAYRDNQVDTGIAEAFAAVPESQQMKIWAELHGQPRHSELVRNIISNGWINAKHAQFDVSTLPENAVSRDLFNDEVLVERHAFMEAQAKALEAQRQNLVEGGWAEAVVGRREDVQDRLYAMNEPECEFDECTQQKLEQISRRRKKLEEAADKLNDSDPARIERLQAKFDALEAKEAETIEAATEHFSEETKSVATAFLILNPDGRVQREYRVSRFQKGSDDSGGDLATGDRKLRTSEDLSDNQMATTFTHQALAVREALLDNPKVRKRILAMILMENVRSEALAIRHEANAATLHASNSEGFTSPAWERLQKLRQELNPLNGELHTDGSDVYAKLTKIKKIDELIDLLTVECITTHMLRRTELVHRLATELSVDVRRHWRPDAAWLKGYQKIQLIHLLAELCGPTYSPQHDQRKKSELVETIASLFTDAAEGRLDDKKLAERLNHWLPSNLREIPSK